MGFQIGEQMLAEWHQRGLEAPYHPATSMLFPIHLFHLSVPELYSL